MMGSNQQTVVPLAHYKGLYAETAAQEITARTGLEFNASEGRFCFSLVGNKYYVTHPEFSVSEVKGCSAKNNSKLDAISSASTKGGGSASGITPYEEILLIRYLLEGKFVPASGEMLAYKDMPWGTVYLAQFHMRVVSRFANEFGGSPERLKAAVGGIEGLNYEEISGADVGYRLEFLDGLFISILIWAGDDEFPGSAQVLFSDNFKYAFTAEDIAVVGDVLLARLLAGLGAL